MQAAKAQHRCFSFLPHLSLIIVYIIFGVNISSMKLGGQEWDRCPISDVSGAKGSDAVIEKVSLKRSVYYA